MSIAWRRLDPQVTMMPGDNDPPGDVEAEPGTLADRLGGEERLEDPVPDIRGNPGAGIDELDNQMIAIARCPDCERSGAVHRRHRVVDQVRPHLVELPWV